MSRTARNTGKTSFSEHFAKIHKAPRISSSNTVDFHLYLDLASVEFFADDNEVVFTDIFFPTEDFGEIEAFSEGGKIKLQAGTVYPLKKMEITSVAE